jgi:hypothetical protein
MVVATVVASAVATAVGCGVAALWVGAPQAPSRTASMAAGAMLRAIYRETIVIVVTPL